jgi:hypothetical protein
VGCQARRYRRQSSLPVLPGISIDLNELVDSSLPLLTSASGVSNNGKIVVKGLNGQLYVVTPK